MKRRMMQSLVAWKEAVGRKPLLFQGARQVGKTWLLKEFGRTSYENVAYVNFDLNPTVQSIFDGDLDIARIMTSLQLACRQTITPGKTLIILDEIQEAPRAVTCLKYFCEDAPQYHIAAAGSYLGVASMEGTGFPVGKVNSLTLHPMSFLEFLEAMGHERLAQCIREKNWPTLAVFKEILVEHLRYYHVVGGMPGAVASFAENRDFYQVRKIQKELLAEYDKDFGKHTPKDIVPSIRMIWNAVPSQLAKENKKFFLSKLQKNARKDNFASAIQWLCDAGLVHRVCRVSKPAFPLSAYIEDDIFKLFLLDVGLMTALSDLDPRIILEGDRVFTEFKGALAEQYVHQQLLSDNEITPYYWSNNTNELDFLFQQGNAIVPLEVKAEMNLRSRSLMGFCRKYKIPFAVRSSMVNYRQDWTDTIPAKNDTEKADFKFLLTNLPLFAISQLGDLCNSLCTTSE